MRRKSKYGKQTAPGNAGRGLRVLMVTEGTYPQVIGGVSSSHPYQWRFFEA
jgi:hypothetical protein